MVCLASGDALTNVFDAYARWIEGLSDDKVTFLVRANLFLGIPCLIARALFAIGSRQVGVQVLAVVVGSLLAFAVPIEPAWFQVRAIRVTAVTLAATLLVFLPWAYSFYVVRHRRAQHRISYALYALLAIGFLLS